tara:strand:- start:11500 stop:12258 length:759 start_codon:yes stop_codon:yes gene_type:complete
MAVNINTVYTTVLYILNKEQRGYINPGEFNSLATQVQEEIFESYFPDGNQLNRANQQNVQNDTEFFNMFKNNAYKLYPFESSQVFTYNVDNDAWRFSGSGSLYNIGEIISVYSTTNPRYDSITELVSKKDYTTINQSKLTTPTSQYPLAYITNATISPATSPEVLLKISPKPDSVSANCVLKPAGPVWGFTVGTLGQYTYSNATSTDFQLDTSEQANIITKILKYAGVIINDPTVIQTATAEAQKVEANEKS